MRRVTSRANPLVREVVRLSGSGRRRRADGRIVLDGAHLLKALTARGTMPEVVIVSDTGAARDEHRSLLKNCAASDLVVVPDDLFRAMAVVEHPSGIMALATIPHPPDPSAGGAVLLLDGVQDPGNVGAILRSAAAAGGGSVLLSTGSADPWSPKALRAGMGAQFLLAIEQDVDLEAFASTFPDGVWAAQGEGGCSPFEADLRGPFALLVGAEGRGLSPGLAARAQRALSIPMAQGVESLNVAVAVSVLLFERARQLRAGEGQAASN